MQYSIPLSISFIFTVLWSYWPGITPDLIKAPICGVCQSGERGYGTELAFMSISHTPGLQQGHGALREVSKSKHPLKILNTVSVFGFKFLGARTGKCNKHNTHSFWPFHVFVGIK